MRPINGDKFLAIGMFVECPFSSCPRSMGCHICAQEHLSVHIEKLRKGCDFEFDCVKVCEIIPGMQELCDKIMGETSCPGISHCQLKILDWLQDDFTNVFNELAKVELNDK